MERVGSLQESFQEGSLVCRSHQHKSFITVPGVEMFFSISQMFKFWTKGSLEIGFSIDEIKFSSNEKC